MNKDIKIKYIIMTVSVVLLLLPTLQIRKLEQNWRNGISVLICKDGNCVVNVYDIHNTCIKTKEIDLKEIIRFKKYVDKTRARNNYASYVINAVTINGEEVDFFEVDTYYDNDLYNGLDELNTLLQNPKPNIVIKYPTSRTRR